MMTLRRILTPLVLLLAVTAGSAQPASAQAGLAYASATAAAVTDPVQPGTTVKTILAVKVSPGFHIQSDKPRDPSLIPLTLTFEAPPGVKVEASSFPPAKDFLLKGTDKPLAVFEGAFSIEVRLAVAKDHAAGEVTVPARLRYQACDDTTCFRPMTIPVSWTLTVGGATKRATPRAAAPVAPPATAAQRLPQSHQRQLLRPFPRRAHLPPQP